MGKKSKKFSFIGTFKEELINGKEIYKYILFLPNSGCLINIGNGPQSGPPLYSKAKGREAAHQIIMGPKAAKWPVSLQCGQRPQSGSSLYKEAYIRYLVSIRNLVYLSYYHTGSEVLIDA